MMQSDPIMIVAPMGRSGTSVFKAMLASHPDLYLSHVAEDYFGHGADKLQDYVDGLFVLWDRMEGKKYTGPGPFDRDSLLAEIGRTMLRYVGASDPVKRPVLKSPSFGELHVTLRMFPTANFLILLRDPRSIVESYLKVQDQWGFDFTIDQLASNWAFRARTLLDLIAHEQDAVRENRLVIVRYERLVAQRSDVLDEVTDKLGLNPFPPGSMPDETFPVIGSSFDSRTSDDRVSFAPIAPPPDFAPLERWRHWSPERHARFNRLCGEMMKRWGYQPVV